MQRSNYWRLAVHEYADAVANGHHPVEVKSYVDTDLPGRYRPHDFDFDHPPTREDFQTVLNQLPWTHRWQQTLVPLIAAAAWPIIGMGKKAATTYLLNEKGERVGELEVRKQDVWENNKYPDSINVSYSLRDKLTRGYRGEVLEELERYIEARELRVLEAAVNWSKANDGVWPGEDVIEAEVRKVINEWKAARKPQKGKKANANAT